MELLKNSALSDSDVTLLREKLILEYSKKKGWNAKELTTAQLLEITSLKEYKSPGLILG